MSPSISPLAPKQRPQMPALRGVKLGSIAAGLKYKGRKDLAVIHFDTPASIAGVLTNSQCPSAPVDWCRKHLPGGSVKCIVINSGNANAFTGKKGTQAVMLTAAAAAEVFNCTLEQVFLASTGVIGEPLDATEFPDFLTRVKSVGNEQGWDDAAETIMTTDTYAKTTTCEFSVDDKIYHLNGIAKGSGMIAPDMATMLSFLITNLPIEANILQAELSHAINTTFNCISVDSDTSTSDTVLLVSTGRDDPNQITKTDDPRLAPFKQALHQVLHDLAMLVIRDGEGATKHIEIHVEGATCAQSAKKIAMSIANSPLVKTAIAGEDANWGRIVMAIGKAGEKADRDLISIWFGDVRVALEGERDPDYDEEQASAIMKQDYIPIRITMGIGTGSAKVWTCDLTHQYVDINADYRS